MKGQGAVVISCRTSADSRLALLRFSDGSWGIQHEDTLTSIWEPAELDECISTFAQQAGITDPQTPLTVLLRLRHSADCAMN